VAQVPVGGQKSGIRKPSKGLMMSKFALTTIIVALGLLGCSSAEQETPTQAIQEIIKLYEIRDFDSLIRTRYAEISKAANEQQVESLITRFATRFGDEAALNQAIETYKAALQITPEISEAGKVVTFQLDQGFIMLSRMPDGKWGFHL
jgi:hypothetical protein